MMTPRLVRTIRVEHHAATEKLRHKFVPGDPGKGYAPRLPWRAVWSQKCWPIDLVEPQEEAKDYILLDGSYPGDSRSNRTGVVFFFWRLEKNWLEKSKRPQDWRG